MGIDATTKIPPETDHPWGDPLTSDPEVARRVTERWQEYGLGDIDLTAVDATRFGYELDPAFRWQ